MSVCRSEPVAASACAEYAFHSIVDSLQRRVVRPFFSFRSDSFASGDFASFYRNRSVLTAVRSFTNYVPPEAG